MFIGSEYNDIATINMEVKENIAGIKMGTWNKVNKNVILPKGIVVNRKGKITVAIVIF